MPTITFKLLHALVFLSHDRRKIIHFDVSDHPPSEWAAQQWYLADRTFASVTVAEWASEETDRMYPEGMTLPHQ